MKVKVEYKNDDGKECEIVFSAKTVKEISKMYIEWADKLNYGDEKDK